MDVVSSIGLGVLMLSGLALVWRARLALTLFVVRIEDGRIGYVKGRIPARLLGELAEVARLERITSLILTCRVEDQRAQLTLKGHSNPGLEQVLRNLLGQYPLTRLRQAPRSRHPE
jgi:hypothetical protein